VFKDLDLDNADELLTKASIADRICSVIQARRLTQARAAELLGVDQPKVSALMRGRLSGFSSDRLDRFLNALGQSVTITVRPARRARTLTRIVS
jgi:predicted XRE-type DNA-binding protein